MYVRSVSFRRVASMAVPLTLIGAHAERIAATHYKCLQVKTRQRKRKGKTTHEAWSPRPRILIRFRNAASLPTDELHAILWISPHPCKRTLPIRSQARCFRVDPVTKPTVIRYTVQSTETTLHHISRPCFLRPEWWTGVDQGVPRCTVLLRTLHQYF